MSLMVRLHECVCVRVAVRVLWRVDEILSALVGLLTDHVGKRRHLASVSAMFGFSWLIMLLLLHSISSFMIDRSSEPVCDYLYVLLELISRRDA